MRIIEILAIVFAVAVVLAAIITSIIKRKQGKCSCDCGYNCSSCSNCRARKNKSNVAKNGEIK